MAAPNKKGALEKFEGSTGDESYLQTAESQQGDWQRVRSMWEDSRKHAAVAMSIFMDMGDLLLTLREGKTDPKFGKLRKVHVPELTRQDATRAMNLARNRDRFLIEGPTPSISVMAELVHSSDELVEQVLEQNREAVTSADPEKKAPTVKEVRAAAKEEKKPETAEEFTESVVGGMTDELLDEVDEPTDIDQSAPLATAVEEILEKPLTERIAMMGDEEMDTYNAFLVMGFNPLYDGDYPCSKEVFLAAISQHLKFANESDARVANDCAKMLEKQLWG